MVKIIDKYLLTASLNHKFIVKMRPFSSAKTSDMSDYIKSAKKDFISDIYVLHVETNDLRLSNTPEQIAEHIFDIVNSLKTDSNTVIVSNIVLRGAKNKGKAEKAVQIINNACVQSIVPVIKHTNLNSKNI